MDARRIARIRMRTQRLWGRGFDTIEDTVRFLGAIQAQEFQYAKWSIAQRTRGVLDADVQRAFEQGSILRTHVLRPTWHFVLPEDIRWMLELTAPRVRARMAPYDAQLDLDQRTFARANRIIGRALEGGTHLTRPELSKALARGGIDATGQRLGHVVMQAELDAVICSGAPKGKQRTYALLEERAKRARSLDRAQALAELARRYFTSHGPATAKDFVWWSGLTMADARAGLDAVSADLEERIIDGRTYWFAPSSGPRRSAAAVDLVQCYDEVVISYTESRDVATGTELERTFPGGQAPFMHAMLIDGRLAGLWRHTIAKGEVLVQVSPFGTLNAEASKALGQSVERYGKFLNLPAELSLDR